MSRRYAGGELSPWKIYFSILTIVFLSEFCVMLILPGLPLHDVPGWVVGIIDSTMLTLLLVPLFGWLVIRPIRQVAIVRANLLEQFMLVQEEERARIVRDLHDEIGQSFSSVLIGLQTTEVTATPPELGDRLEKLASVVTRTLEDVRRLARGLRPAILDHLGLFEAVEQYVEEFQSANGIDVEIEMDRPDGAGRLPSNIEIGIFRIVQESLTNILRHANASRVNIALRMDSRSMQVEIVDGGEGFVDDQANALSGSGMRGMAERALLLNGTLSMTSKPGQGTRVSLWVPLGQEDRA